MYRKVHKFYKEGFHFERKDTKKSLKEYETFYDVFTAFQEYINEDAPPDEKCTVKEIDVFLFSVIFSYEWFVNGSV